MPGAEIASGVAVLDASIAVRWIVPEPGSDEAAMLLERSIGWIAPRLILSEVAGALRRKVADDELLIEEALQSFDILAAFVADGTIRIVDEEPDLLRGALLLAVSLQHKIPDCVYLALAEYARAALFTADRRLAVLAERRGVITMLLAS